MPRAGGSAVLIEDPGKTEPYSFPHKENRTNHPDHSKQGFVSFSCSWWVSSFIMSASFMTRCLNNECLFVGSRANFSNALISVILTAQSADKMYMAVEHRKLIKEGYFYFFSFFFYFFCFQPGAVFPAICCILELKFVFACILELESPLCGFCGLLVSMVFVFFLWFLGSRSLLVSVACVVSVASVDFVAFGCFW